MTTVTADELDLIRDAACDFIDYRDGAFFRCGVLLPVDTAERYRQLVFAGLLKKWGQLIQLTAEGKQLLEATR